MNKRRSDEATKGRRDEGNAAESALAISPSSLRRSVASSLPRRTRRGFTLVEVLATLMLMAIVLPAIFQGVTLSTRAASSAKRRNEASALAESQLAQLAAGTQWQAGKLSGDFGADWPDYHWDATVQPWGSQDTTQLSLQQIDLHVTWIWQGKPDSLTLSTLVYVRQQVQAAGTQ